MPAALVIASDVLPVTATLYQAAKIAAAAAPFVEPGGTLAIVAECSEGVGPLETVNEAILRIGVLPRLPPNARLVLISALAPDVVRRTLVEYAPSLESVVATTAGRILVLPRASQLLCEGPVRHDRFRARGLWFIRNRSGNCSSSLVISGPLREMESQHQPVGRLHPS